LRDLLRREAHRDPGFNRVLSIRCPWELMVIDGESRPPTHVPR
jgi:hypothetical protein